MVNTVNRLMTNICSDKLEESKAFYIKLFDLNIEYDSDWFVHLSSKDKKLEFGIVSRTHEIIPKEFQKSPQGIYITFVVDNADDVYKIAMKEKFNIVEEPKDTFYGQRRLLLKDPNDMLVDISSLIPNE